MSLSSLSSSSLANSCFENNPGTGSQAGARPRPRRSQLAPLSPLRKADAAGGKRPTRPPQTQRGYRWSRTLGKAAGGEGCSQPLSYPEPRPLAPGPQRGPAVPRGAELRGAVQVPGQLLPDLDLVAKRGLAEGAVQQHLERLAELEVVLVEAHDLLRVFLSRHPHGARAAARNGRGCPGSCARPGRGLSGETGPDRPGLLWGAGIGRAVRDVPRGAGTGGAVPGSVPDSRDRPGCAEICPGEPGPAGPCRGFPCTAGPGRAAAPSPEGPACPSSPAQG